VKELIIKTQAEYDALGEDTEACVHIEGGTKASPMNLYKTLAKSYVYVRGNATIQDVRGNATIQDVCGNATIQDVCGNATIQDVCGNATIRRRGNATIQYVRGNATIQDVYGNATIQDVCGNATIQYVYGNATIKAVYGLASILMVFSCAGITTYGYNIVRTHPNVANITVSKNTTLLVVPDEIREPRTFVAYQNLFPVEVKKTKAILYKAVHKIDGKYIADYDKKTEYVVGKKTTGDISSQTDDSCSVGLHVSHKKWAITFGAGWNDCAVLECEVPISKIVVAKDTDGKCRTSELKVIRELPESEW
jgi:hypothetical protein